MALGKNIEYHQTFLSGTTVVKIHDLQAGKFRSEKVDGSNHAQVRCIF